MGFQADVRAGVLQELTSYASSATIILQVYGGRPRSINPPTAFIDVMRESINYVGHVMQRTVQIDVVLVHGSFDSVVAAGQKDAFVDGFIDQVRDNQFSAAGANTTLGVVATEDDPTFIPAWLPRDEQRTYYATRITLEGYQGD
jgi:hypothetical protein